MVLSFIHPATCGFARGVAWQLSKQLDEEWKFGDSEDRLQLRGTCPTTIRYNRFKAVSKVVRKIFPLI